MTETFIHHNNRKIAVNYLGLSPIETEIQHALGTIELWKLSTDDLIYLVRYITRPTTRPTRGLSKVLNKIRIKYLKICGWRGEDFTYEEYVKCLQHLGAFPK